MSLKTPVAFCIFNRPDLTRQVFDAIAKVQPESLLVIGDGPRVDRLGERELVAQTRDVLNRIDWPCQVKTNFSERNLGCKQRMATGIDWAFEQAEELIILEDDCLPNPSFFRYCEQLLERYRHDDRIMMISGDNFQPHRRSPNSYYFSRWPHIWGWASWRRAWRRFDVEMKGWPAVKSNRTLASVFSSEQEYQYWEALLDRQYAGEIDTWDFPWAYACWIQNGLTILPETNLVSNLGFAETATHTTDTASDLANLPTFDMDELIHPRQIAANEAADQFTWENILSPPAPVERKRISKWYHRFTRKPAA
jgi:hypothetical protein